MITLKNDTLSFTFPEIAQEVRSLVEHKIQQLAAELPPTWDRTELLSQIESHRDFHRLSPEAQGSARDMVRTCIPANVEERLQHAIVNRGGLSTDSFTELTVKFQRTMRIPDDGKTYALPTGLGQLPLRSVDDFAETMPASWMTKGGAVVPLNQSEALWIWFSSRYRFALKVAAGPLNALTGEPWSVNLQRQPQNYVVLPDPTWEDEVIRHLVSMPLDAGLAKDKPPANTTSEGIQIQVVPMRVEPYYLNEGRFFIPPTIQEFFLRLIFAPMLSKKLSEINRPQRPWDIEDPLDKSMDPAFDETARRQILEDPYEFAEWDQTRTVCCFVHPCNSAAWRQITGTKPSHPSLTEMEYQKAGIPWVNDYGENPTMLPESSSSTADRVVRHGNARRPGEIREFLDSP